MKQSILAAATAALLTTTFGTVHAADIVTADPVLAPVIERSWTGAYIGGSVGGIFENDDSGRILFDTNLNGIFSEPGDFVPTGAGADAFAPGFCSGVAQGNTPAAGCDDDDNGITGAVRLGYDYQYDAFVFGGLVDFQFMDIERTSTAFSVTPTFYSIQRELDFTVAARAKLGYAASDSLMAYATGGIVFGDIDHSFNTGNGVNTFTLNEDDDNVGYQVGAGMEYRFTDNISFTLEYLYTDFGDDDTTVRVDGGAPVTFRANNPNGTDFALADDNFDYHSVMVGMNYRF